jgi:hypothetical protein
MKDARLILGVTRRNDEPKGPASGLIYREDGKLKWGDLGVLFTAEPAPRFFRLVFNQDKVYSQALERVEYTVNRAPRFLFKQPDGKLRQEELTEKLQFSEARKALLKPQKLGQPLVLPTLAIEYLEVSRLSDAMRREMLAGERSVGQLAEIIGVSPNEEALTDALWELSRQGWIRVHDLGKAADNAIALNKPAPGLP